LPFGICSEAHFTPPRVSPRGNVLPPSFECSPLELFCFGSPYLISFGGPSVLSNPSWRICLFLFLCAPRTLLARTKFFFFSLASRNYLISRCALSESCSEPPFSPKAALSGLTSAFLASPMTRLKCRAASGVCGSSHPHLHFLREITMLPSLSRFPFLPFASRSR